MGKHMPDGHRRSSALPLVMTLQVSSRRRLPLSFFHSLSISLSLSLSVSFYLSIFLSLSLSLSLLLCMVLPHVHTHMPMYHCHCPCYCGYSHRSDYSSSTNPGSSLLRLTMSEGKIFSAHYSSERDWYDLQAILLTILTMHAFLKLRLRI